MSFVLLKDASVVTTGVPISKNIFERMFRMKREFEKNFAREPESFLLGPKEMLRFEAACYADKYATYSSCVDNRSFVGLPVRLKNKPGIELEADARMAPQFLSSKGQTQMTKSESARDEAEWIWEQCDFYWNESSGDSRAEVTVKIMEKLEAREQRGVIRGLRMAADKVQNSPHGGSGRQLNMQGFLADGLRTLADRLEKELTESGEGSE